MAFVHEVLEFEISIPRTRHASCVRYRCYHNRRTSRLGVEFESREDSQVLLL